MPTSIGTSLFSRLSGLFLCLLLHLQNLLPAAVTREAVLVEEQHRPVAEEEIFGILQRRRGAVHHAVGFVQEVAWTIGVVAHLQLAGEDEGEGSAQVFVRRRDITLLPFQ